MNTKPYKPYGGRSKKTWRKVLLCLVLAALVCYVAGEIYITLSGRSDHLAPRIYHALRSAAAWVKGLFVKQ